MERLYRLEGRIDEQCQRSARCRKCRNRNKEGIATKIANTAWIVMINRTKFDRFSATEIKKIS